MILQKSSVTGNTHLHPHFSHGPVIAVGGIFSHEWAHQKGTAFQVASGRPVVADVDAFKVRLQAIMILGIVGITINENGSVVEEL